MKNLEAVLNEAKTSFNNVVKTTIFLAVIWKNLSFYALTNNYKFFYIFFPERKN